MLSGKHTRGLCVTLRKPLRPQRLNFESLKVQQTFNADAERALLDARLTDMEGHPGDQSPWPEVKARLERLTP